MLATFATLCTSDKLWDEIAAEMLLSQSELIGISHSIRSLIQSVPKRFQLAKHDTITNVMTMVITKKQLSSPTRGIFCPLAFQATQFMGFFSGYPPPLHVLLGSLVVGQTNQGTVRYLLQISKCGLSVLSNQT